VFGSLAPRPEGVFEIPAHLQNGQQELTVISRAAELLKDFSRQTQ